MFGSKGAGPGELHGPAGVAIDGDRVYVTDCDETRHGNNHCIAVFSTEGKFLKSFGCWGEAKAQFQSPHSVHVNKDGFILVADHGNDQIQVF